MEPITLVRTIRSGLEESVHTGDVAAVDAEGRLVASAGDPNRVLFARSAMKPVQAAVSLSLAAFAFTDREVAVMAASHNAEWVHLEAVRTVLARAGLSETDLQCPAMRPWDDSTLGEDPARRRINSDCSGKHAGMLAACIAQGWPLDTYREPDHPLQQAILRTVRGITGLEGVHVGVDGCGVPVHGMPVRSMARLYACLASPDRWGELAPHLERVTRAMRTEPYLVAGRNRVDTALMEAVPGLIVKGGAEGLLCASSRDRDIGLAVKIRDGTHRAAGPALIHALTALEVIATPHADGLADFVSPPVIGGGIPVGRLVAEYDLQPA
jgi:L-asparaginase II